MKRTAFLQALLIFILLIGSWILLVKRLKTEDTPSTEPPDAKAPQTESAPAPEEDPQISASTPAPATRKSPVNQAILQEWTAIKNDLETAEAPYEMRIKLQALRDRILTLPKDEALKLLLGFLDSDIDIRTGLSLHPRDNHEIAGASDMRAMILHWLHLVDPVLAGQMARKELSIAGTDLHPDVYVVHLRNGILDPTQSEASTGQFITTQMERLLSHQPWMANPNSAIVESFDILVYSADPRWTAPLASFLARENPKPIRHAAALSLERMVDAQPEAVLPLLMEASVFDDLPKTRASYYARLDPVSADRVQLLRTYLLQVPDEERAFFLSAFPNMNLSLSYNLLTPQQSQWNRESYSSRIARAIGVLESWAADPELSTEEPQIRARLERIQKFLGKDG